MPAGIEVYNTHGTLQINSTSHAMAYNAWLGAGTPVQMGDTGGFYVDLVPTAETMLAIRPSATSTSFAYRLHLGGNTYRYFFVGGNNGIMRFEKMVTPTAKVGLQVFNGAGVCMFDSAQLPMLVVGILGPVAGSLPVPAGRTYAVVTLTRFYGISFERWTDDINWYQQQTVVQSRFWASPGWIHYNPSVTLTPQYGIINPSQPHPPDYTSGQPLYYVIDVTGY